MKKKTERKQYPRPTGKTTITVYMDKKDVRAIDRKADKKGLSRSLFVTMALRKVKV